MKDTQEPVGSAGTGGRSGYPEMSLVQAVVRALVAQMRELEGSWCAKSDILVLRC